MNPKNLPISFTFSIRYVLFEVFPKSLLFIRIIVVAVADKLVIILVIVRSIGWVSVVVFIVHLVVAGREAAIVN